MRRILVTLAVALVAAGSLASFALAARSGGHHRNAAVDRIVADCVHSRGGFLRQAYVAADLRLALRELPADVAEYSGCADAIRAGLSHATATLRVGVHVRGARRLSAATVVLRDGHGRLVGTLHAVRGARARAVVAPGRYTARATVAHARCAAHAVTLRAHRTATITVACRRRS